MRAWFTTPPRMSNPQTLKPFKSGYDPRRNTKGRPKGQQDFNTMIREVLKQKVKIGGKMRTYEELIWERLVIEVAKGNPKMTKLFYDHMYGKAK